MIYTISKNSHRCYPIKLKWWNGSKPMIGEFMLPESAWYDTDEYGTHLNKLVGFGTDFLNDNSIRLAWRPAKEYLKFEIYVYLHFGGVWVRSTRLKDDLIATIHANVTYSFGIFGKYTDDEGVNICRLVVGGNPMDRAYDVSIGTGWFSQFWYGGKPVAPQDMYSEITVEGWV